jgi:mono/diheme cytochrome c family protein
MKLVIQPFNKWCIFIVVCVLFCESTANFALAQDAASNSELVAKGQAIYGKMCAECHGANGEGATGAYDRPLVGDLSIGQLAKEIDRTMPEGDPSACVGEDAHAVAAYLHQAFYSEAAQLRQRPAKQMLSRLTAEQLRQSLSDLYSHWDWSPRPEGKHGISAHYYRSSKQRKEDLALERVDPGINFDFGRESPGADIPAKNFVITWDGGLRVDQSGQYEIIVRSSCSFTLNFGRNDRMFIDNHVQSGDKTEFRELIRLTAGRLYPFHMKFIQRERKTELPPAAISVSWVTPDGFEQLIPLENWVPGWVPAQYATQAAIPPDDRSYGFERGIKVDRDWDAAVTTAAVQFSQVAATELWPEYRRKHKDAPNDDRQVLKSFLRETLNVAFRYSMTDELAAKFVDSQVAKEEDDKEAIKRVMIVGLKSPRFLYPQADVDRSPSARVGTRLALTLLDSLPVDQHLRKEIEQGKLETEEQIRGMAWHLIGDYRVRAKTKAMLYEWMNLSAPKDRKKHPEHFAGFDDAVVQDLRRSLDALLDEVTWSETSDFRHLLLTDWGYTTARLQKYFGESWNPVEPFSVANPASATEVKAAVCDELKKTVVRQQHAGVLTHPYLTSAQAYHDSSSPIHRGVFLLRNMLGRSIQPPQDAAFSPLSPDLHPDLTTRERVILQTSPENCAGCHDRINSLGFALENWDASGRFRDVERNKPIDPSGYYINRSGENVKFANSKELAQYIVTSEDAHQAFVRRAFQHFTKQPPAAYGPDTLDRLTKKFLESQFNMRSLLVEIAVVAAMPSDNPKVAAN